MSSFPGRFVQRHGREVNRNLQHSPAQFQHRDPSRIFFQVPGPSSSCVPWSKTPPGAAAPRPIAGKPPSPSGRTTPWAPGMDIVFEATTHGPHARGPTLRRSRRRGRRKDSLPARVGSPLAGRVSHPLDDERSFMESSHPPFPFDQPRLVAPFGLYAADRSQRCSSSLIHIASADRIGLVAENSKLRWQLAIVLPQVQRPAIRKATGSSGSWAAWRQPRRCRVRKAPSVFGTGGHRARTFNLAA